ncbi:actin rearrangement inducing factor-1 [Agrotis ipsilon multiple nucleopolyhedrovirus]|uniref:Actin rearrangement inducing factor-1 n=1 Tax=Agrotis ipsilon multiple nucleopolyhedrovirus TaxID=208013 RepID=B6D5V5_9ABAC|nr:actin rearrangement inducing factor-1 [Agrotis ipsilon multiple nucleopolyhedrovirus]ACI28743.1 actin rearrangement inducing factor-1 [Agrotis ipsilon multiple nucleopolyhedrovirus]
MYMALSLSCIARAAITFIAGVALAAIGLTGIVSPKYALLIDYANGSPVFNCSGFVFMYGVDLVLMSVGGVLIALKTTTARFYAQYLLVALTILLTSASITVFVFICTYNWVVEYGHIAALDVYVRTHDTEVACWDGIVRLDYNSVQRSVGNNCFYVNEYAYCALCRHEYYSDEPTFIKSHRFEIIFILLALLLLNAWTLRKLYLTNLLDDDGEEDDDDFQQNSTTTFSTLASSSSSDYYAVPKNNKPVSYWYNPDETLLLPPPPSDWMLEKK